MRPWYVMKHDTDGNPKRVHDGYRRGSMREAACGLLEKRQLEIRKLKSSGTEGSGNKRCDKKLELARND